jgi:OmpA-OmpF porin, OOP family
MKFFTSILVAAAMACTAGAACAQTYVGITGGMNRLSIDDCTGCNKFGVKLYGGYKFTPNVALEGAYTDFGSFKFGDNASARLTALSIGGAFFYEMAPQVNLIGRIGLASGKVKASGLGASESENKISPYLGAGVGYALTPELSLNGSIDLHRFKYNSNANVFSFGVGVSYQF